MGCLMYARRIIFCTKTSGIFYAGREKLGAIFYGENEMGLVRRGKDRDDLCWEDAGQIISRGGSYLLGQSAAVQRLIRNVPDAQTCTNTKESLYPLWIYIAAHWLSFPSPPLSPASHPLNKHPEKIPLFRNDVLQTRLVGSLPRSPPG